MVKRQNWEFNRIVKKLQKEQPTVPYTVLAEIVGQEYSWDGNRQAYIKKVKA